MEGGLGIDIVHIDRFREYAKDKEHPFLTKTFFPEELSYCFSFASPAEHLAGIFAAKEAVWKALPDTNVFTTIEVRHGHSGAPQVWREGTRLPIRVSIAHDGAYAVAVACT